MDPRDSDQLRESELFGHEIDPIAQELLDAVDPWDAYDAANRVAGALVDDLHWLPHGGAVYIAWAELTDLYETGKTPIPDAHAALRQAAARWLERPALPTNASIEDWVGRALDAVKVLVGRDGDFWRPPS